MNNSSDGPAGADSGPPPQPSVGAPYRDLHPTSDIRFVMVEVAKLTERVNTLIEDNKAHKADFRWTWGGLVLGFLVLSGLFIDGYMRLADRLDHNAIQLTRTTVALQTRIDDFLKKAPAKPK